MHSPILQQVQMVLSGKKNWRFMDEPTSAPETCAEGAFTPALAQMHLMCLALSLFILLFFRQKRN